MTYEFKTIKEMELYEAFLDRQFKDKLDEILWEIEEYYGEGGV